jgi:uncharacterized membrane protein
MIVLAVLAIAWLIFRAFTDWRTAGRWALAVMLLLTASAHFTSMRHDLVRMVPGWVPWPEAVVTGTGVLELAGAAGLLIRRTQRAAGICLALLFIAMFPANIKADREQISLAGSRATPLVLRIPMQVLFVWLALWSTSGRPRQISRAATT